MWLPLLLIVNIDFCGCQSVGRRVEIVESWLWRSSILHTSEKAEVQIRMAEDTFLARNRFSVSFKKKKKKTVNDARKKEGTRE